MTPGRQFLPLRMLMWPVAKADQADKQTPEGKAQETIGHLRKGTLSEGTVRILRDSCDRALQDLAVHKQTRKSW